MVRQQPLSAEAHLPLPTYGATGRPLQQLPPWQQAAIPLPLPIISDAPPPHRPLSPNLLLSQPPAAEPTCPATQAPTDRLRSWPAGEHRLTPMTGATVPPPPPSADRRPEPTRSPSPTATAAPPTAPIPLPN